MNIFILRMPLDASQIYDALLWVCDFFSKEDMSLLITTFYHKGMKEIFTKRHIKERFRIFIFNGSHTETKLIKLLYWLAMRMTESQLQGYVDEVYDYFEHPDMI